MSAHDLATLDPEEPRFGGKARSLARLVRAGFAVPKGFVLPPEALAESDAAVEDAVRIALAALGPGPYAVRSSALAEDSREASFAGQHATVLGARTLSDVLSALERVRDSAGSSAARAYREALGAGGAPPMAVVIQVQVAARAAGVAFTADPVSGDRREVVVAAVRGLGETLVSGERSGDTFRLSRKRLRLLAATAGEGGEPALSEAEARAVARAALNVEGRLGLAPANVEWAFEGDRLWLLQARPVTTAVVRPIWFFPQRLDEMLSGPVSPLMTSLFDLHFGRSLPEAGRALGLDFGNPRRIQLVRRIHGRPYVNATLLATAHGLPGREHACLDVYEGSGTARERRAACFHLGLGLVRRARFLRILGQARALLAAPSDSAPVLARSRAVVEKLRGEVGGGAADADLVSIVLLDRREIAASILAVGTLNALSRVLGEPLLRFTVGLIRWLAGASVEPMEVVGPAHGLIESEVSERLFALSRLLRADRRGLAAIDAPGAPADAFRAFLAEHGDRGPDEADIAAPRWRDDPAPLRANLESYLALPDACSPALRIEEREQAHRRAMETLAVVLGPGPRLALLAALAQLARRLSRDGENTKHEIVRFLGVARAAVLELGRRLTARGQLADPDEVFLLTAGEVEAAVTRSAGTPLAALVARRRAEQATAADTRPPRIVDDRLRPLPRPVSAASRDRQAVDESETTGAKENGGTLRGIGASPGRATGRVRIVRSPAGASLGRGEVLVARQTDPSWTPLFVPAAAVVVEVGSLLSHASIVARELGIPSVVSVRGALAALADGDWVEVDGSAGTVTRASPPLPRP